MLYMFYRTSFVNLKIIMQCMYLLISKRKCDPMSVLISRSHITNFLFLFVSEYFWMSPNFGVRGGELKGKEIAVQELRLPRG